MNELIKDRQLTKEQIELIENCGRVGFSCKELAAILSVPVEEVENQFRIEHGSIYEPWLKGRMQVEVELRQSILRDAINGSTQMMDKMLSIFSQTDESIKKLTY